MAQAEAHKFPASFRAFVRPLRAGLPLLRAPRGRVEVWAAGAHLLVALGLGPVLLLLILVPGLVLVPLAGLAAPF